VATVGDHDRARALAVDAEQIARSITNTYWQAQTLIGLATAIGLPVACRLLGEAFAVGSWWVPWRCWRSCTRSRWSGSLTRCTQTIVRETPEGVVWCPPPQDDTEGPNSFIPYAALLPELPYIEPPSTFVAHLVI
jgi:hypothetical protein